LALGSVPDNGSYSFGTVTVDSSSPPAVTFYVENLGDDNLNLTGTPHVAITGPDALLFSVTNNTSSMIAPSGWSSFNVTFDPTSEGDKTAAVRIENDDPDTETYYEFTITGFGSATDIKIYWTDYDIDTIHRSNLDGSTIEDLIAGRSDPAGIALEITGSMMYWTEKGVETGSVFRSDLLGASVEELITGLSDPRGIALNLDNTLMYWTDAGTGEIERSDFEGLSPETLITGLTVPYGIVLDSTGNRVYWICNGASSLDDKICRAELDGSNTEDLITGLVNPSGIALDTDNDKIYWTEGVNGPSTARIRRADLSTGDNRENLVTGLSDPCHIVIDPNGRRMYWTDAGYGKIQSSCLDGADVVDLITGITPCGIAIGN
jgi:sugar lactone lactonase YvrE